jgi:putative resolvase
MAYVPLRKACLTLGVHANTLRKWADDGRIDSIRTEGGQRRFNVDGYLRRGGAAVVGYCRVSSARQRDDLERQVAYLRAEWPDAEIVKDVGSGLNFKRKGLCSLLERAMRGEKLKVVVAHRDRLARFGFDVIAFVIGQSGGEIVVLNEVSLSPEAELKADLCAIIQVFSCRINGRRKYKSKTDQTVSDGATESPVEAMVRRVTACVQQDCRDLAAAGPESELEGDHGENPREPSRVLQGSARPDHKHRNKGRLPGRQRG